MKCEPLKNEKQKIMKGALKSTDKSEFNSGFKKGVDDSFNVFSSSVELFKRYKNNVKLLMNEQREVWLKFVKYYESQSTIKSSDYLSKYNNWLFDYMFSDINEMNPDDFLSL